MRDDKVDIAALDVLWERSKTCEKKIYGHNGTYWFPCVRSLNHEGVCNRIYRSGGPCAQCHCEAHAGKACTDPRCGSSPCRAGLSWDEWYAREREKSDAELKRFSAERDAMRYWAGILGDP